MGEQILAYNTNWDALEPKDREDIHGQDASKIPLDKFMLNMHSLVVICSYDNNMIPRLKLYRRSLKQTEQGKTPLEYLCDNPGKTDIKIGEHCRRIDPLEDAARGIYEEIGVQRDKISGLTFFDFANHMSRNHEQFVGLYDDCIVICELGRINYNSTRISKQTTNFETPLMRTEPIIVHLNFAVAGPNCKYDLNGGLKANATATSTEFIEELMESRDVTIPEYHKLRETQSEIFTKDSIDIGDALYPLFESIRVNRHPKDFPREEVRDKLNTISVNSYKGHPLIEKGFNPILRNSFTFIDNKQ